MCVLHEHNKLNLCVQVLIDTCTGLGIYRNTSKGPVNGGGNQFGGVLIVGAGRLLPIGYDHTQDCYLYLMKEEPCSRHVAPQLPNAWAGPIYRERTDEVAQTKKL